MAITAEELKVIVHAEVAQAKRELRNIRTSSKNTRSEFKQLAKSLLSRFGVAAGITAVTAAAVAFTRSGIQFNAQIEQTSVAFETMLKSASGAKALIQELSDFAASTPFQLNELTSGAQRLLAFGTAATEVKDVLRDLGNAAQGQGDKLDRLVNAYGKLQAKGKASLEELNMFTEAGVPIMAALQDQLVLTKEELFDYITKGKVGFEDVNTALQNLTRGEGQFAGMLEKQSQTLLGLQSTLRDNVKMLAGAFTESLTPALKNNVTFLTSMVIKMREGITAANNLRAAQELLASGVLKTTATLDDEAVELAVLEAGLAALEREAEGLKSFGGIIKEVFKQVFDPSRTTMPINDQIAAMKLLIEVQKDRMAGLGKIAISEGIASRALTVAAKVAADIAAEKAADLAELMEAFGKTKEGQILAAKAVVAYWKTFKQGAIAQAVVRDFKEELDLLLGVTEEVTPPVNELAFAFAEFGDEVRFGTGSAKDLRAELKKIRDEAGKANTEIWDLGSSIEAMGKSLAMSAAREGLDALRELGKLAAGGEGRAVKIFDNFVASVLRNLPQLLLGAGFEAIGRGHWELGIALIAASGLVALGAGIFEELKDKDESSKLDDLKDLDEALKDLDDALANAVKLNPLGMSQQTRAVAVAANAPNILEAVAQLSPEAEGPGLPPLEVLPQTGPPTVVVNIYGDVNDADKFEEKVATAVGRMYATS